MKKSFGTAITLLALCLSSCFAHTHTFDSEVWDYDEEYHWHPATCEHSDEKNNIEKHSFNKITTQPTGQSGGYTTYMCSKCGYSYIDDKTDPLTYTITWKNWDGSVLETDTNVAYGSTPSYDGSTPTKSRTAQYTYTFSGWSPSVSKVTSDATYIAQFSDSINSYTVTWKNWDGSVLETDTNVAYGSTPSYDDSTPTKSRTAQYTYTFSGWSPSVSKVTSDATYTAQYSSTLTAAYVSFDLNGGTTSSNSQSRYMSSVDAENFFFDVAKENYSFRGWEYNSQKIFDGKGNKINNVDIVETMTFRALFCLTTDLYTIHFETNGGDSIEDLVAEAGEIISVNHPTRKGYTFVGWYTDPSLSLTSYYELGDTMPAFNGTLYAKWSLITYTITYHLDAMTTNNPSNPTNYNILTETITLSNPTVSSHRTFVGWYTDQEFNNPITQIVKGSVGNLDIYAKETATIYTITFVTNGGGTISPISGAYGDPVIIPTPTKGNSIFVGWFTDSKLTNRAFITTMPGENITLYAKWVDEMYTVFEIGSKQYMYFGSYPQSVVSDSSLKNELAKVTTTNSSGYYEYGGSEYAKKTVDAYNPSCTYANGSKIVNKATEYFKVEPILWRVLASDSSGNYTLLADQAINAHDYDQYSNDYANSSIRTWLNSDFFNGAFKSAEKGAILTTNVDNSASTTDSTSNPYICDNTDDKVFLFSYKDYLNSSYGFSTSTYGESTRYCKITDYAIANKCYIHKGGSYDRNCPYWTRSPYSGDSVFAWCVDYYGQLRSYDYVNRSYQGVRPALNINL